MLQLNYTTMYLITLYTVSNLYVYMSHIYTAALFYPLGIVLTFYVLLSILYMVIKASILIVTFIKLGVYMWSELENIGDYARQYIPYLTPTIHFLLDYLYSFILNYSVYWLVFYLKRVQFYIFWLFVILAFC